MTAQIGLRVEMGSPEDNLVGGQPLWYWALTREGKENELRRRAEQSGTEYVHDGSRIGLAEDGAAPDKDAQKRLGGKIRMTKARREAIERRAEEIVEGKKSGS